MEFDISFFICTFFGTKLQFLLSGEGFGRFRRVFVGCRFIKKCFFFSYNIENKVSTTRRRQWRGWAPSISGERSSSGILYRCPLCPLASLDHSSPHSPSTILHSFWTLIPPVHSPLRPGTDLDVRVDQSSYGLWRSKLSWLVVPI